MALLAKSAVKGHFFKIVSSVSFLILIGIHKSEINMHYKSIEKNQIKSEYTLIDKISIKCIQLQPNIQLYAELTLEY